MHEWMNEWTNTYNQTFRGLNESQIEGLCDFPQREQNAPPTLLPESADTSSGWNNNVKLLLNYFSRDDRLNLTRKIITILSVLGTAAVNRVGVPLYRIPSNGSKLDFGSSLSLHSGSSLQEPDTEGPWFREEIYLHMERKRGWCPGMILVMTAPSALPEKRHSGALFQIRPESLAF